jgi:dienelactone hydrolase
MTDLLTEVPREKWRTTLRYWARERKLPIAAWTVIVVCIVGGLGLYAKGDVDPIRIDNPNTSFGTAGANLVEVGALGPDVEVGAVGKNLTRTYIIRARGAKGKQPAVIMLHGFGSMLVVGYEPWIEHLAREGFTVIFPTWQQPPFPVDGSQNPRTDMFDGVRLAVKAVPVIENQVAVMGFSAGAALAYDYAALSKGEGVPPAGLVYSVFPGRAFPGETKPILPIPPSTNIPPHILIDTLISTKDRDAGTKWGIQQYDALRGRGSQYRKLTYITAKGLTDHFAPAKYTSEARRTFWTPFDDELKDDLGAKVIPDEVLRYTMHQNKIVAEHLKQQSIFRQRAYAGTDQSEGGSLNQDAPASTP